VDLCGVELPVESATLAAYGDIQGRAAFRLLKICAEPEAQ
jgi:hypothetical protein